MINEIDLAHITHDYLSVEYAGGRQIVVTEPSDEFIRWSCRLIAEDDDFDDVVIVATAELVVIRAREHLPQTVCDTDGDLEPFCALFDSDGQIRPEIADALSDDIITVNRVTVQSDLRGRGLGRLLVAEGITDLGHECGAAALAPAPFELPDSDAGYQAELARLNRLWTRFGFTINAGIGTIDLAAGLHGLSIVEAARRAAIDRVDSTAIGRDE